MSTLDAAVLVQLAEDTSPADVRRIAAVFEEDLARLLPLLAQAVVAGDHAAWRGILHGIAGASSAVGGVALDQAARDGSHAVQAGQWERVNQLASQTIAELRHWVAALMPQP